MQACKSANALIPRQLEGCNCDCKNSQHASFTSVICRILAAGSNVWKKLQKDKTLVGLEFNGPVNTVKVKSSQSVYLTTLFLGRLSPLI